MNQAFIRALLPSMALAGLFSPESSALGQTYSVNASTIDGGGGPSSGGSFSINGTLGQPDAASPMIGGAFTALGGFWSIPLTGPTPPLAISLAGANSILLRWPNPSIGYVLQQTANMSSPNGGWTDVMQPPLVNGTYKEVALAATGRSCMFRLRKL